MSASTPASASSASSVDSVTLARPDDWHLHLRDGAVLAAVLPHTARQFGRAIIMPNLRPPVTTTEMAAAYRERILAALPKDGPGARFEPLMTLYLTDNTPPDEIRLARESGFVHGVKLYPAGATTNSDAGVTSIAKCAKTLEAMQKHDLPLLVHGEVTDPAIDMFDREKVFIDRVMTPLRRDFPALKVVFEHITTKDAADYVRDPDRRHADRAPSAVQPQCAVCRRNPAALLLLAGAQARDASRGAARGGYIGQSTLFPRHGQRAAREGTEGARLRLRGLLHGAARAGALHASLRSGQRARSPRGLREFSRRGFLRFAALVGERHAASRALDATGGIHGGR